MRSRNGVLEVRHDRLPIVDVAYSGMPALEDIRDAFQEYSRIAERGVPLLWLIDMRQFDPLQVSAHQRRQAALVFQEHAPRLRRVSVAEARVITSPLTRGIVTAFDWLTGANKWPCAQFGTIEQAESWLNAQLARRG
jgi:hypothetical protein